MKKTLVTTVAVLAAFALAGCGSSQETSDATTGTSVLIAPTTPDQTAAEKKAAEVKAAAAKAADKAAADKKAAEVKAAAAKAADKAAADKKAAEVKAAQMEAARIAAESSAAEAAAAYVFPFDVTQDTTDTALTMTEILLEPGSENGADSSDTRKAIFAECEDDTSDWRTRTAAFNCNIVFDNGDMNSYGASPMKPRNYWIEVRTQEESTPADAIGDDPVLSACRDQGTSSGVVQGLVDAYENGHAESDLEALRTWCEGEGVADEVTSVPAASDDVTTNQEPPSGPCDLGDTYRTYTCRDGSNGPYWQGQ